MFPARIIAIFFSFCTVAACTKLNFLDLSSMPGSEKVCSGPDCLRLGAYSWVESGYAICSKPCGMGAQTQDVYCLRHSDNVAVADSFCTGPKPAAVRSCNLQTCLTPYTWNTGPLSACSRTCGGGWRERKVICQDQGGSQVADSFCAQISKPTATEFCNANLCPTKMGFKWSITSGSCSKPCGEGLAHDKVECKKSDGSTVDDKFCKPARKPPASHLCNINPCEDKSSYTWLAGAWGQCSRPCGPGLQTRSVVCQKEGGAHATENLCDPAERPSAHQACNLKTCPVGRKVEQRLTASARQNSVDLVVVVDDSAAMSNDQNKLASRLGNILADFDTQKIDYQVCLTTTDAAFMQGSPLKWKGTGSHILKPSTPSQTKVIADTFASLGINWSRDEQGVRSFLMMMRDHREAGCVRTEAALAVILLSDENERSVGGYKSWSPAQYKPLTEENDPAHLRELIKVNFGDAQTQKPFIWNSIIVKPYDSTCQNQQDAEGSPSFYGTVYADLANQTGGLVASICEDDYGPSLREIKTRILNALPGLQLECEPLEDRKSVV